MKKLGEYSVNYVVSSLHVASSHCALFSDRGLGKVHEQASSIEICRYCSRADVQDSD